MAKIRIIVHLPDDGEDNTYTDLETDINEAVDALLMDKLGEGNWTVASDVVRD